MEECTWEWCVFWYCLFTECLVLCKECKVIFVVRDSLREELCLWISEAQLGDCCLQGAWNVIFLVMHFWPCCVFSPFWLYFLITHEWISKQTPLLLQGEFLFCLFPVQCTLTNIKTGMLRAAFPTVECMEKEKPFSSSPPSNPQLQFTLFLGQEKR